MVLKDVRTSMGDAPEFFTGNAFMETA